MKRPLSSLNAGTVKISSRSSWSVIPIPRRSASVSRILLVDRPVEGLHGQLEPLGDLGSELLAVDLAVHLLHLLVLAPELVDGHRVVADGGGHVARSLALIHAGAEVGTPEQGRQADDHREGQEKILRVSREPRASERTLDPDEPEERKLQPRQAQRPGAGRPLPEKSLCYIDAFFV